MWRDRRVSQVRQSALQWVYVSFHVLKVAAEVRFYPTTPMIQLAVARNSATAGTKAYIRYFSSYNFCSVVVGFRIVPPEECVSYELLPVFVWSNQHPGIPTSADF